MEAAWSVLCYGLSSDAHTPGLPTSLFPSSPCHCRWVIDATRRGGSARFINHSCDPNCSTKTVMVDGRKHICIYAKRRIEQGEELCYDYKFQYEADVTQKVRCNCGARNCSGWMC